MVCSPLIAIHYPGQYFGHAKASLTGSLEPRTGRSELADGGTLLRLPPEVFLRHLTPFVQPCCTITVLPVPGRKPLHDGVEAYKKEGWPKFMQRLVAKQKARVKDA